MMMVQCQGSQQLIGWRDSTYSLVDTFRMYLLSRQVPRVLKPAKVHLFESRDTI